MISILDHELAQVAIAELLTEFEEHPLANLLTDGHARAQLARLGRRRDLEEIDVQRPADRLAQRRGKEAGRDAAAVAASAVRSPLPSSLTGRLKMTSDRMSDSSSGGVLLSSSSGSSEPLMCTRASTPVLGITRRALTSSNGLRSPVNRIAAADEIEVAALELIGSAHRVDHADHFDRRVRFL